jgi:carbonic anhydrase/acetyltransferase-like protein (isoleucine patch superfamily)
MLVEHRGKRPQIAPSAHVAPTAVVCGDVVIGERSRIRFGVAQMYAELFGAHRDDRLPAEE